MTELEAQLKELRKNVSKYSDIVSDGGLDPRNAAPMPPITTSEEMVCGAVAHGGLCVLPAGHNMGRLDIPSNHKAAPIPTPSQQEARITKLESQLAEWEKLKDPINLHVNLLRGVPCKLDRIQHLLHLAGATDYDDLTAANAKMKACLEAIAEHHEETLGEIAYHSDHTFDSSGQMKYHTERGDFAREGLK